MFVMLFFVWVHRKVALFFVEKILHGDEKFDRMQPGHLESVDCERV